MILKKTNDLFKHAKHYVSANIVTSGLSLISLPIMTRLLIPSDYGVIATFTSFVLILGIIFGLGISGSLGRYYYEETSDFKEFFGANTLLLWTIGILLSLIGFIFRENITSYVNLPIIVVDLALVMGFCNSTYEFVKSYLTASKQSSLVAKLSYIQAIGMLISTITITYFLAEQRYLGSIGSQVGFSLFFFIISAVLIKRNSSFSLDFKHIRYSLTFGIPIIFHLLSGYILNNFDQMMINKMIGSKETGLYSLAYKVGMLQQIVTMGITQSWTPLFFEKMKNKQYNEITSMAKNFAYIVSLLALFLILFSSEMITILADSKYHEALPLIPIIIVGYLFNFLYLMYVSFAFYEKKTHLIAIITIISGGINIGLNYWLLPIWGYEAAAWTTLFSFMAFFILHYSNVRLIIKPTWTTPLLPLITPIGVVITIAYLFTYLTMNIQSIFVLIPLKLTILLCIGFIVKKRYSKKGS